MAINENGKVSNFSNNDINALMQSTGCSREDAIKILETKELEKVKQELPEVLSCDDEPIGDNISLTNKKVKKDDENDSSMYGWAVGIGCVVTIGAGILFHKKLGSWTKNTNLVKDARNFINMKKMKNMHSIQLEDGTYYAQSLIEFKNGKYVTKHLKTHLQDPRKELGINPYSGRYPNDAILKETRYNPATGLMETVESNGGRFCKGVAVSQNGEIVYSSLSADGTIIYKGYNKNFEAIPSQEQIVTCLDKKGNVIEEFKGVDIKFGLAADSSYSEYRSAKSALDVSSLRSGPLVVDRYTAGDFKNLTSLMKEVISRGPNNIIENSSRNVRKLAMLDSEVAEAEKLQQVAKKAYEENKYSCYGKELEKLYNDFLAASRGFDKKLAKKILEIEKSGMSDEKIRKAIEKASRTRLDASLDNTTLATLAGVGVLSTPILGPILSRYYHRDRYDESNFDEQNIIDISAKTEISINISDINEHTLKQQVDHINDIRQHVLNSNMEDGVKSQLLEEIDNFGIDKFTEELIAAYKQNDSEKTEALLQKFNDFMDSLISKIQ